MLCVITDRSQYREKENIGDGNDAQVAHPKYYDGRSYGAVFPSHLEGSRHIQSESEQGRVLVKELPRGNEESRHTVMKRKVLRKVDGQTTISESFAESETGKLLPNQILLPDLRW